MADDPTATATLVEVPSIPKVLVLYPPPVFTVMEAEFCREFEFIKAYESPLPLEEFLSTSPEAATVTVLFSSAMAPQITADGILRHLPLLRCIVTSSAGVNHIDLFESRRRGIVVANATDVFSDDVADLAIGLLIDVMQKISAADRLVRCELAGEGEELINNRDLRRLVGKKKVGIVGLGSIGHRVAKRLEVGFGCEKIMYHSRTDKSKSGCRYTYYPEVEKLASDSDVLVICCALTEETRHLIDRRVLLALGKEGVIINVARGAVIDEKELVRCLLEGDIGGAGLDVFEDEPFVPKELIGMMNNVVLQPHCAAVTWESFRALYEHVTGNLRAFFSNKPLLSQVEGLCQVDDPVI